MKFFDRMKDKKVFKKQDKIQIGDIDGYLIDQNDHINIVHNACKLCYERPTEGFTYEQKSKYIADKIKVGHESILEHSNIIIKLEAPLSLFKDYTEFSELLKFVNIKTIIKNDMLFLMIAGSIRGYKHIIRYNKNPYNKFVIAIKELMYQLDSCYFVDFIKDDIMVENKFLDIEMDNNNPLLYDDNLISIVDMGKIKYDEDFTDIIDMLDMYTVSVLFKKVPRVISQQMTRHRVAITQKSQRYVDYSIAEFIAPVKDKYKDKRYKINLAGNTIDVDAVNLGYVIRDIYPQLRQQEMEKEDARAYLPNNIETSLYMTFTYKQLFHFLNMRCNGGAQADVKVIANDLQQAVLSELQKFAKEDKNIVDILNNSLIQYRCIYDYLKPRYIIEKDRLENDIKIDEIIEG